MKAIVYARYGPPEVLSLEEVARPAVGDDDVQVEVCAAALNPLDWHFMRGTPYLLRLMTGLRKPKNPRPGVDLAGRVLAVGRNVSGFRPGDEVFGAGKGALAEVVCASGQSLALKPANLSFEEAAGVNVAGLTALQGLRDKGRLQAGQKVLINGAAGGVGSFAVQLAKAMGAEVTGVCSSGKVELVRSLGADHVLDPALADFTRQGRRYDVLFDTVGNHPLSALRRALEPRGALVMVGAAEMGNWLDPLLSPLKALVVSWFVPQTLASLLTRRCREDLEVLRGFLASGRIRTVVDRIHPLTEVPLAMVYLEAGHARGKVIIKIQ